MKVYLNGNRCFNGRMRVIVFQRKISKRKIKYVIYCRIYFHGGVWARVSAQLQLNLLKVVAVNMCIAKGVHKIARLQATYLRHHEG